MNDLELAKAMASGHRPAIVKAHDNVWFLRHRITGTGVSYRSDDRESGGSYVYREPNDYLNRAFIAECAGVPVIMGHPEEEKKPDDNGESDSRLMNPNDYRDTNIGAVFYPYENGQDVWAISRIYSEVAIDKIADNALSTSPMIITKQGRQVKLDGESILLEGEPIRIESVAIVPMGVWDKRDMPLGIFDRDDIEEIKADSGQLKADKEGIWRTTETGSRLLFEPGDDGFFTITGGAGGKLNGKRVESISDSKTSPKPATTSNEATHTTASILNKAHATTERKKERRLDIHEIPLDKLSLSKDVPQFKSGANNSGVVEPLGGAFDREGVAPIQVWQRKNGDLEVISGRHRLDLARRSGEASIPTQVHRESEGVTAEIAAAKDAILNIRDGQGKVSDFVQFFKTSKTTPEDAEASGYLARNTGKQAFTIANKGTDLLIDANRTGRLSNDAATAIADTAPNNEGLQNLGMKLMEESKTIGHATNMMRAAMVVGTGGNDDSGDTFDMFGNDDTQYKTAEAMAKYATAKQREYTQRYNAIQGAAKNPKLAKEEGIDVSDPDAIMVRVGELKNLKNQWDNWQDKPGLITEIKESMSNSQHSIKADGEHWITINGARIKIEGDDANGYTVKSGAGGKINGLKVKPKTMSADIRKAVTALHTEFMGQKIEQQPTPLEMPVNSSTKPTASTISNAATNQPIEDKKTTARNEREAKVREEREARKAKALELYDKLPENRKRNLQMNGANAVGVSDEHKAAYKELQEIRADEIKESNRSFNRKAKALGLTPGQLQATIKKDDLTAATAKLAQSPPSDSDGRKLLAEFGQHKKRSENDPLKLENGMDALLHPMPIANETDKAYAINNPNYDPQPSGYYGAHRRAKGEVFDNNKYIWVPKSQATSENGHIIGVNRWVEKDKPFLNTEYAMEKRKESSDRKEKAFKEGADQYTKLIEHLKGLGVKGIRNKMRTSSIIEKAIDQGINSPELDAVIEKLKSRQHDRY